MLLSCVLRNISNLRYFRRHNPPLAGTRLEWVLDHDSASLDDLKRALTDHMLSAVGLAVVDDDKDTVPSWLVLTPPQRRVRKLVTLYKVGLKNATRTKSGSEPTTG